MFNIITKEEYWSWLEAARVHQATFKPVVPDRFRQAQSRFISFSTRLKGIFAPARIFELKDVQDAYIRHRLVNVSGQRILEIGGGDPRVLPSLALINECWLVDRFEGVGRGPTQVPSIKGVKVIPSFIGDFDPKLPDAYFDIIFSISVLEHVPLNKIENFFGDCARLLKPGGLLLHAIDTYLFDDKDVNTPAAMAFAKRTQSYLEFAHRPDLGLHLSEPPDLEACQRFSCRYASLPDNVIFQWQRNRPDEKRLIGGQHQR
jgi:SAM-dependent methyltransferase